MDKCSTYRTRLWLLLALMLTVIAAQSAPAATYYVATNGFDANSGTSLDAPLQTVQHAAALMVAGDVCYLRGGTYHEMLAPANSGNSNASITFAAYSNEVVTLDGADVITGWTSLSNGIYQASAGWTLGEGFNQVFVDGTMIHQAQYPDYGGGDVLHPATTNVFVNTTNTSLMISVAWTGKPDNYWAGAWFLGGVGESWAWQSARVLTSTNDTITVDPATQTGGWWFTGKGSGVLWGKFNLLDADNEWHLQTNFTGNILYLRIPGGNNPSSLAVELKRRNWCVYLNGKNYITVSGLNLRAGAIKLQGVGNVLENCKAAYLSHYKIISQGYFENGGTDQGGGVMINGNYNVVRGCTVFDTAGSGIYTLGSSNRITRNVIYNTDYSGTYASSLNLHGNGDIVTFNTAYASGRDILRPEGSGADIRFNDFSYPGILCKDLGVIYAWGINGQAANGPATRIAYNWIHDNNYPIPSPLIYLDDWDRNFVVDHNVCWNSGGDSGIRINGPAFAISIYNNTLFNCDNVGVHTFDSWPGSNPDPAFWTGDFYQYAASNNLVLAASPQTQLMDWRNGDYRLLSGAPAINAGVTIPGFTDGYSGNAPDLGAYEFGNSTWSAGVASQPQLSLTYSGGNIVTLKASPDATYYSLYTTTNLASSSTWKLVTNNPATLGSQWSLTLLASDSTRFYRLQTNSGSAWSYPAIPPAPIIITPPATVAANLGGPALLSVSAVGVGPLFYQWRSNGQAISGATNSTLSIFPVATKLNYDVIITNFGGSVTSTIATITPRAPYKVSLWRMEAQVLTPNAFGTPSFTGIFDADTASGQGIATLGSFSAAQDDLITFNGLPGGPVVLSNSVPPATMFVNGNTGGAKSYNAAAIAAVNGALFFPQDVYGNEFSFNSPFSIEFFFRTHGNQSGAGKMQLVMQGESTFRYGSVLNDAIPGSVTFIVSNQVAMQAVAALTDINYADGGWHYLLAVYDTPAGRNG